MSLESQLIRDEGLSAVAYKDSRGNITFGVGHKGTVPLSKIAISQILDDDITAHTADLVAALPWVTSLTPNRFNALRNMCFNLGIGRLLQFKVMIAFIKTGDYKSAAEAGRNSAWYIQVGARAERLMVQLETDVEQ